MPLKRPTLSRRMMLASGAAAFGSSALLGATPSALAQPTRITVTGGTFEPIPIAIPAFETPDPALAPRAQEIIDVITADLENSGLFRLVRQGAAGLTASMDIEPLFSQWGASGAEALLVGAVEQEPDGRIGVRFRLWSIPLKQQLEQLKYLADPSGWRRISHKVSDVVYSALTGEDPYFDSRVVFVEERGPKNAREKRLAIMDQDGANVTYLTSGANLVLTPRFSPVDQEITFISYQNGEPQVYLLNLRTERQELLGNFPGMTFAPRFSPDGKRVVMSLARGGASNIFLMDLATRRTKQLTNGAGINTAPSFSPDGESIVFESDRGSSQQIYVMNSDGSDVRRISFGEGRYATPVWSPRGDLVAFTKMVNGRFHIGAMRIDGTQERLLTSSFLDEGPTWSPNGRVVMFYREAPGAAGRPALFSVDITGRNLRQVPTPSAASDPAWSPLLSV